MLTRAKPLTDDERRAEIEALEFQQSKYELAYEERNDAVKRAVVLGIPVAEVARTIGLTRARVYQIIS